MSFLSQSQVLALPQAERIPALIGHLHKDLQDEVIEEVDLAFRAEFGEDYWLNEFDPESRNEVSESDYWAASREDRADLDLILAWEEFGGFHNP